MTTKKTTTTTGKVSTGASKVTPKTAPTGPTTTSATREIRLDLPIEELDKWVHGRLGWNENEWSQLLDTLRQKGYKQLVDNPNGQLAIGQYLEEKRMHELRLPTTELSKWLKGRHGWNHNDWLGLLSDLRGRGYSQLTDTEVGRQAIGKYLEENRT